MPSYHQIWIQLPPDYLNLKTLLGFLARIERLGELYETPICAYSPFDLAINGEWLAINESLGGTEGVGPFLKAISEETQLDALYFSGETICDTFAFCRWHAGRMMRAFEWQLVPELPDDPHIWTVVEGEPEPWERKIFFPEEHFGYWLKEGYEGTEAEKLNLQKCWTAGRIAKGFTPPVIPMSIGGLFYEIVKQYNLPTSYWAWFRPEKVLEF